ncbi:MAG: molecular chaperone [Hyphomicrobiaceae bacterium]
MQASPTLFELAGGKAADTLKLRNEGTAVLNAQVRVFRWSQVNGDDKSEPTADVVASPPALSIAPGGEQIVRIVRVSKRPPTGEENFRVVVDELPDKAKLKPGEISFTFKHSIPMFVMQQTGGKSQVSWAIEKKDGKTFVVAKNNGSRRARIAGLTLKAPGAKDFVLGKGLNGYVLSGSSMRWVLPSTVAIGSNGPVTVTARSDEGPINATAQAQDSVRR